MRNFIGGWSATYDSCIAQRAIVGYAVLRGFEITTYNIRIDLTSPSVTDQRHDPIVITDGNLIETQVRDVQNVWGVVFVDGFGNGYALVQVSSLKDYYCAYRYICRCMWVSMLSSLKKFVARHMFHFRLIFNRC